MEKLATCLLSLITHFHANFPQSSTIGRLLLWYIFPLDVFPRESPRALLPPKLCNTRISQQHRTFRFVFFSIRAHSILSFHTNFPTRFQRATIFPRKNKTPKNYWKNLKFSTIAASHYYSVVCGGKTRLRHFLDTTEKLSLTVQAGGPSSLGGSSVIRWHFEWISNIVSEWILLLPRTLRQSRLWCFRMAPASSRRQQVLVQRERENERTGLRVVRVAYCLAFVFALSPFESMANWTGALIEGEGKLSLRGQIIWVGDFRSRAFEGKTSTEVRLVEDFRISLCLEVFC